MHYARRVNQTLRTAYTIAEMRELLNDEQGRADIDLTLALRETLLERVTRARERPDAKKNPDLALLVEVVNQLV